MKFISNLILIPIAIVVALFAVANRQAVTLGLWPLPFDVTVPLFITVLAALLVGFLAGGTVAWVSAGRWRRRAHAGERRTSALENKIKSRAGTRLELTPGPLLPIRRLRPGDDG